VCGCGMKVEAGMLGALLNKPARTLDDLDESEDEEETTAAAAPAVAVVRAPPPPRPPPARREAVEPSESELGAGRVVRSTGAPLDRDELRQARAHLRDVNAVAVEREGSVSLPGSVRGGSGRGFRGWGYGDEAVHPLSALGECGDKACGCYRMTEPEVRPHFELYCVRRIKANLEAEEAKKDEGGGGGGGGGVALDAGGEQPKRIAYASFGSGLLLFDVCLLDRLWQEEGIEAHTVYLLDPLYREKTGNDRHNEAVLQFARWFPHTRVVTYESAAAYAAAVRANPSLMCDVFMRCDAAVSAGSSSDDESDSGSDEDDDVDAREMAARKREKKKKEKEKQKQKSPQETKRDLMRLLGQAPHRIEGGEEDGGADSGPGANGAEDGGVDPAEIIRLGGLLLELSNNGGLSNEHRKGGKPRGNHATSAVDCFRKVACDADDPLAVAVAAGTRRKAEACKLVPFREEGQNAESAERKRRRLRAQAERAFSLGLRVFRVVFDQVVVRSRPSVASDMLGGKRKGDLAVADQIVDRLWIRLAAAEDWSAAAKDKEAFMLTDGKQVGLGTLLREITHASELDDV